MSQGNDITKVFNYQFKREIGNLTHEISNIAEPTRAITIQFILELTSNLLDQEYQPRSSVFTQKVTGFSYELPFRITFVIFKLQSKMIELVRRHQFQLLYEQSNDPDNKLINKKCMTSSTIEIDLDKKNINQIQNCKSMKKQNETSINEKSINSLSLISMNIIDRTDDKFNNFVNIKTNNHINSDRQQINTNSNDQKCEANNQYKVKNKQSLFGKELFILKCTSNIKSILSGQIRCHQNYHIFVKNKTKPIYPKFCFKQDWMCYQCGNINFNYRNDCCKCLKLKSELDIIFES